MKNTINQQRRRWHHHFRNEVILIRNHKRGLEADDSPLPIVGAGLALIYDNLQLAGVIGGLGRGKPAGTDTRSRARGIRYQITKPIG
ncbi:hypothetical protein FKG94_06715 [Exilibacterium tricleocarpae]|uniref:Uncharacterized protein n=1 Tax=Exilibacterium tricleocarpae TaxID=2591008 RepID=A0A545TYY5_9GAMM|nr:hypothetical protein [Exilibacterium tricleocarpae]TQV82432.1 hypothetical protein FKG94_06715 [Exilibacterium tricleocarpae]